MDLELATTLDILQELRKRDMHFVFVGMSRRNRGGSELYLACQGTSCDELQRMLSVIRQRLIQREETD